MNWELFKIGTFRLIVLALCLVGMNTIIDLVVGFVK
jgi:hypothetical protein